MVSSEGTAAWLRDRDSSTGPEIRALIDGASRIRLTLLLGEIHGVYADPAMVTKVYCPFGMFHRDGGVDRALRVYPQSNTAYCFAGCGFIDPIRLFRLTYDLSPLEAAKRLVETYGEAPQTWDARLSEALRPTPTPDLRTTLVAALHNALSADPRYGAISLEPYVMKVTRDCLMELDPNEDPSHKDPSSDPDLARAWLATSLARVAEAMRRATIDPTD
jgi:hypothetical protein